MKTYLVAVCGLSPQVITETLYALHQQGMTVDAIHILTTRPGKDACIGQLFRATNDGEYYQYLAEHGYDPNTIDFSELNITAVLNNVNNANNVNNGVEIDDIDTEEENECFLKLCMETAFKFTKNADDRVFFSIAGGRRTMGACLSLAAQCYARPQDRIYHVLLSPSEFDSCRDFFYPPKKSRMIEVRTRYGYPCHMETSLAQITLVPLPFFPLRDKLAHKNMLNDAQTPATLMLSLVREPKHELTVDLLQRKLIWRGVELDLSASRMAFYAFFVRLKKESNCQRSSCQECAGCHLSYPQIVDRQKELTRLYQKFSTRETGTTGIVSLKPYDLHSYRSKINSLIAFTFGTYDGPKFLEIGNYGEQPVRYGLKLDRSRIRIIS